MIFEMQFQILVLAATASVLASYAVAENPAAPLARSGNFAATNGVSEGAVAIFTEFGNEMAWEGRRLADSETLASTCAQRGDSARSGGQLERLIHRVSQSGAPAEGRINADAVCEAP